MCRQCFSLDQRLKVKHAGVSQWIEDDARSDTSDRLSDRRVSFLSDTGGLDADEGPSTTQPGRNMYWNKAWLVPRCCCQSEGKQGAGHHERNARSLRPLIRSLTNRTSTGIEALALPVDVRRSKTFLRKLPMRFEPHKVKERCLWARQALTARYNYALKLSCYFFRRKLIAGCLILIV